MRNAPHSALRNWARAIPGLTVVGLFAALLYTGWERNRHLLRAPMAIEPAVLQATGTLDQLPTPFVTLPVPRQLDTGVQFQRLAYAVKSIQCDYVVIPVADKWLIAEVPTGFNGQELTGYLAPWSSGVHAEALEMVRGRIAAESLDELLPFQFEAGHDLQAEARLMAAVCVGMILLGLMWAALWTRRRTGPQSGYGGHPQFMPAGYRPSYR